MKANEYRLHIDAKFNINFGATYFPSIHKLCKEFPTDEYIREVVMSEWKDDICGEHTDSYSIRYRVYIEIDIRKGKIDII